MTTTPPGADLYRAALDALEHPVALLDSQGTVVAANRLWSSSPGADPLAGATVGDSVVARLQQAGPAGDAVLDPLRQVLTGDGPRVAHNYLAPDGRPFRLTATPLAGGGAVLQRSEEEGGTEARQAWEDDVRRQAFLAEASALLISTFDADTILRQLARMAVPHIADGCLVDLVAEDRDFVRRIAYAQADPGVSDIAWEDESGVMARDDSALRLTGTTQPVLYAHVDERALVAIAGRPEAVEMLRRWGLRSAMVVPIVAHGRTLGTITLAATHSGRWYTPADLAFGVTLGERAGLAVDNARVFREAQEANRMKDEFLATLSHELRTPLNAIVGWAHVLRGGPLDKAVVARAVDTIDRNARTQTQLISDILDVSRIVTGKLRLSVGQVALPAVVESSLEAARPAAAAKEIRIEAEIDPLAGPVSGDIDRLHQVVGNLLGNAIKFTPKGGRVKLKLARLPSEVEILVEDSGVGIAPEYLPRLFERFRHPDSSTTRPQGGIGLGLAIVRHLVELHGGRVEAASGGRGRGSTFRVRLPRLGTPGSVLGNSPGQMDARPARPRAGALPSLDGVRVLVVDDEKDAREVIVAILEQRGARTFEAATVEEALARLEEERPDVLVSDIGLPEEDGYSLMRRIRALPRERGGGIPAAAITAYARIEDRMQALLAGFQIHVPKPVQPAELIAVVASLAARKAPATG
jgi:signal transduction histidine kinase/ActR/RegA family two-component response regulator